MAGFAEGLKEGQQQKEEPRIRYETAPDFSTLKLSGGGLFAQGDIRVELDGVDISRCVERIELILDAKAINRATIHFFGNVQFEEEIEQ